MKKKEFFHKVSLLVSLIVLLALIVSCNLESQTYTVIYYANDSTGGVVPAQQLKANNQTLIIQSNIGKLVKTGYIFSGWNTKADGTGTSYAEGAKYTSNAALALFAKWTANKYTATFDYNGATVNGKTFETKEQTYDSTIIIPTTAISKTGYVFKGWATTASATSDNVTDKTYQIDSTITYYAVWVKTYTITYNANGATTGTAPESQEKTPGENIKLQGKGDLVKTGYTFLKWNTDAKGNGISYEASAEYNSDAILNLFAQWKANTYKATFDYNKGSINDEESTIIEQTYDSTIELPTKNPTRTGYTFKGWQYSSNGTECKSSDKYTTASNITLKAIWNANTYNATFDFKGGKVGANDKEIIQQTYDSNIVWPVKDPEKTGYTLKGWKDSKNMSYGKLYIFRNTDDKLTLNAQWEANKYTATFDYNGATVNGNTSETKEQTYDATIITPTTILTRTDYIFKGWATTASATSDNVNNQIYKIAGITTYYAVWQKNAYSITYNVNGATTGTAPNSQEKTHGTDITLQTNSGSLAKTGYTFSGWNTKADGSGTSYEAGAKYSSNAALNLFAKWTANKYDVYFVKNDGSSSEEQFQQTYDAKIKLPTSEPTRTGYTFTGWNTKLDGTGTSYKSGDIFKETESTLGKDQPIALYAQWKAITYKITYKANGATSGTAPESHEKTHGIYTYLQKKGDLVKTGYSFNWMDSNDNKTIYSLGGFYNIDKPLNLLANWIANEYKVEFDYNGMTVNDKISEFIFQTYDSKIKLPKTELTKYGYDLAGWNNQKDGEGNITYQEDNTYTTDSAITLYPLWKPKTYTITYNANGATGGNVPTNQIKEFGTDIKLLPNSGKLVKEGLAFAGWNTSSDGKGTPYKAGDSYSGNGDITLYASWISANALTEDKVKDKIDKDGKFNWGSETYTEIDKAVFYGNTNLKIIEIPDTVTKIGFTAFCYCTNLISITIPNSVTEIEAYAFNNCENLTEVKIANSISVISENVFSNCINLTTITLPEGLKTIGNSAFSNCNGLTTVSLPKEITNIESRSFANCTKLTTIKYGGTKEDWGKVSKKLSWKTGSTELKTIVCSDGDITL